MVFHLVALHEVGSNNPDGVEIKKKKDSRTAYRWMASPSIRTTPSRICRRDGFVPAVLRVIVFFAPALHGLFLEPANFEPANALKTPADIHPLWYFGPFYAILRSIPTS